MAPDYVDEGEDRTLDKIIEALEKLIPPEEPPANIRAKVPPKNL
jgi:hypothetical protein